MHLRDRFVYSSPLTYCKEVFTSWNECLKHDLEGEDIFSGYGQVIMNIMTGFLMKVSIKIYNIHLVFINHISFLPDLASLTVNVVTRSDFSNWTCCYQIWLLQRLMLLIDLSSPTVNVVTSPWPLQL